MREMSKEELAAKQADSRMRKAILGLFSPLPEAKLDAIDALKEAWCFDDPSFRADELAAVDPQAAIIAAARRDGQKEIITWLTKI